ncbi:Two-component sensor histidine kinase, malate [Marinilactibacillus psychrotolerans 42ea]|uniref:histidine kinase n=2 Tax=Marinilactibacillus psychrotolerans TaxID=191770 RepID=A0A1R4J8K8_9LACT|nr:Two-component sensor histidine kinase, malate [Marinilactibacillus psychrotolerans 42ea]
MDIVKIKMNRQKWFRFLSLRSLMILLILLTVFFSLGASALLVQNYVVDREYQVIENKISSIARIVAKDDRVIGAVTNEVIDPEVQEYANEVLADTDVEFIVVLDNNLIRYSHPEKEVIGGKFSNIEDASRALDGSEHFSEHIGILGAGRRFFTPIINEAGEQVGIVCVGITNETIAIQNQAAQEKLIYGLAVGLMVGLTGSILLANKIKKTLLGLEPKQIATRLKERKIITDAVVEGIIAISMDKKVLLMNENAKAIFKQANLPEIVSMNGEVSGELYTVLFSECFSTKETVSDHSLVLNHLDIVVNISPIWINQEFSGAVATVRDQSEMKHLLRELSGTEQYIDSLRAQSHNFLNQLHVILGLIELEKYEEVKSYISILNKDYHEEIGYITEKVKSPALAGFLLGKSSEAKEKQVLLTIDKDSYFPNIEVNSLTRHLIVAIGVLLDNAFEAVQTQKRKEISLYLHYDKDEGILTIKVTDTGIGMSSEEKKKIFQRGFSTKGNKRGYGLDAVQTIIRSYNGIIDVESKEQIGSKVLIELDYRLEEGHD